MRLVTVTSGDAVIAHVALPPEEPDEVAAYVARRAGLLPEGAPYTVSAWKGAERWKPNQPD